MTSLFVIGVLVLAIVVVSVLWADLLERDAIRRFGARTELPKVSVVRDERLDIRPALRRKP